MGTLTGVPPSTHSLTLEDGSARLELEGELDLVAEPTLASLLDRCTTRSALVVVDLRSVAFLSCGALRLLLRASWRTRVMGGRFIVVRGQAAVERLCELIGVDRQLELVAAPPERPRLPRSGVVTKGR